MKQPKNIRSRAIWIVITVALFVGSWQASAEEQSVGPDSTSSANSGTVEEIVVTAQKRTENAQSVPITINVITSTQIQDQGITGTDGLVAAAPGLQMSQGPSGPQVFLRGVGTKGTSTGEEGTNAVYIDGVYQGSLPATIFDFSNVERVEVLKGPQGTLFGRNATGGAINVITADPKFVPELDAELSGGNYARVAGFVHATGPIAANVAGDVSFMYRGEYEGYGHDLTNGVDIGRGNASWLRSKLLWHIDDDTTFNLAFNWNDEYNTGQDNITLLQGATARGGAIHQSGYYDTTGEFGPLVHDKRTEESAKVIHQFSFFEISDLAAYSTAPNTYKFDQDGTAVPFVQASLSATTNQFTNELQIQSLRASRIQWVSGFFYLDQAAKVQPLVLAGTSQGANVFTERYNTQDTHSYAGFGQATLPVTDRLNITGGVRYTRDNREAVGDQVTALPTTTFPYSPRELDYGAVTGRAALDYRFTEDVLGYVSFNRGFKSGEFALFSANNIAPVKPETINAYEVGLKTELLNHSLRVNGSVFYYDYKDIQLSQQIAGVGTVLRNAAAGEIKGADLDVDWIPIAGLTLRAAAEYLHAEYTSFPDAPITAPTVNAVGVPTGGNTTTIGDASGNDMILAPPVTISLSAGYNWDTPVGGINFDTSYYHNGGFFYEPDNRLRQPAYDLVDGQIRWTAIGGRYGVRVFAKNLFDKRYTLFENSSVNDVYIPGLPRNYGLGVFAKFQ